ncbi:hypothetical protein EI983_17620 [Roseovarius faecimaris]|uniref:Fenitrothion hydrolase n=1 Tax=Roseovarius faecimaris TaxID=2494550 RepID=A0A6I6ISE1_9RHOB|nr:hypothetical protein [Roseovarius faecimaris]QGX99989.1 hypothetical protein EI983_17620 [Roseovarius faecimaris]
MRISFAKFTSLAAIFCPTAALAHVSEQAFVLLLPTEQFIIGGCLAVAASILLVSFLPKPVVERAFTPRALPWPALPRWLPHLTSLASFAAVLALVVIGLTGPRDPLSNLLPMMIWTGWWITIISALGLIGNFWTWINPWSGLYRLLFGPDPAAPLRLPERWGVWPAWAVFVIYFGYFIADPAPSDPDRLAISVACYWLFTFAAMALFGGKTWLARGEAFSVAATLLARCSLFGDWTRPAIGLPGWALGQGQRYGIGLSIFALTLLAAGSFDGLKETFWWLGLIGVNPLEFPGRSAVIGSSLIGLGLAIAGLVLAFALVVWACRAIANTGQTGADQPSFRAVFTALAPAVLPIALAYHISHFTVSFLIEGQYLLAAIGDPLAQGANFLGLGDIRVTTGFLNSADSVKVIWLTQAGVVVAGHVLSVLVAHHAALELFGTARRAAISQIPMGLFMIGYTLFGLWLLATPRGL